VPVLVVQRRIPGEEDDPVVSPSKRVQREREVFRAMPVERDVVPLDRVVVQGRRQHLRRERGGGPRALLSVKLI
jgi:hypothetical protein